MPRAEPGSTKWVGNKMRAKGLQRLRWYCQACEKQCRDANGFKCHTQSESHVRQMQLVAEHPREHIERYSREFLSDFVRLLRTSHGEKYIRANRFYQEYIANKEHVHMNATKFASLTNLVEYLGREGICQVKEDEEEGLCIAFKNNSLENVRRREAIQQAERSDAAEANYEERRLQQMMEPAESERLMRPPPIKTTKPKNVEKAPSTTQDARYQDMETGQLVAENGKKFGFSLKSKMAQNDSSGLRASKSKNVLKRARLDGEEKEDKKKSRAQQAED